MTELKYAVYSEAIRMAQTLTYRGTVLNIIAVSYTHLNVERIARTDPKIVATLVKSWLLEDER